MAEPSKMLACRLPVWLIDDAKRHANLYHSDVSKLLREALGYRLAFKSWPPVPRDILPGAVPPHVDTLLHDLAQHLAEVRQELAARQPPEPPTVDTSADDIEDMPQNGHGGHTVIRLAPPATHPALLPGCRWGLPCKGKGHVTWTSQTGETFNLRNAAGKCVECVKAAKRAT